VADVLSSVLRGLSFGSVYALLAVGLVLAYRTTGVFNLAFGPQAFFAAAVYYDTHVTHGWSMWAGLVVSVLVVSPLVGVILDRGLFRFLRSAGETAKLVSVLGLFVALPQMVFLWFGTNPHSNAVGVVPRGDVTYRVLSDVFVNRDDIAIIVVGLVALVALGAVLRYTPIGLRMRAVVESARLTELAGVDADRASMVSWMLSSGLAGLAGVLLTPVFAGQVDYVSYQTLVVAAIAAAAIGGLNSIAFAFAGGLGLGVLQQLLGKYLPQDSIVSSGLRPALPFVVLFAVLVFFSALSRRRAATDPLAGVDPPPPALAAADRPPVFTTLTRAAAVVFCAVVGYWLFFRADDNWVDLVVRAATLAIIFLSITVITGFAGQVSLCQATFAAIGACATGQLATGLGMSVLVAMVLAAGITAVVGALVAIPALRLGGVFLSLATLAFAYFFQQILLPLGWVGGGILPVAVPRPKLGPFDFGIEHDRAFLVLVLVVLAIVSILVIWVRSGTTGRFLDAVRGSEVAAASIGISLRRARITAFALSAAIAGLGGGLVASFAHAANITGTFDPEFGLVWIVLVVTLGPRTVEGAIQAAVGFVFIGEVVLPTWIPWLVNAVQPWYHMSALPAGLQPILFGLGALTYAKHPEGVLEFNKRKSYELFARLGQRLGGRPGPAPSSEQPAPELAATATVGGPQ
jgi:branched-subunit amino acid ABC-type transport system permease component